MTKETLEKAKQLENNISNLEFLLNKMNNKEIAELTSNEVFKDNLNQIGISFVKNDDFELCKSVIIENYTLTPNIKSLIMDFYNQLYQLVKKEINDAYSEMIKL